jgi:hypothetical protein
VTATILNVAGMSLDALLWWTRYATAPVWHIASIAVSAALLAVLVIARRAPSIGRISSLAFVAHNVAIVVALWHDATMNAHATAPWIPFQPHKLGAMAVALLAPPRLWSGGLSIALFVGSALLRWASIAPELKARAPTEPWAVLAFGMFAAGIYAYRAYSRSKERRLADALADARIAERLSRIVLALQDLANTPLQTLELTSELLARRGALPPLIERMQRALARLRSLSRLMGRCAPGRGAWLTSIDSRAVIQRVGGLPPTDERIGPAPGAG